ncbi:hypothetical protein KEM54_002603 [Ascosphaera aggregata]|nr:hypothetical protein KEM54_002603 [Ascosphaera aggregata]
MSSPSHQAIDRSCQTSGCTSQLSVDTRESSNGVQGRGNGDIVAEQIDGAPPRRKRRRRALACVRCRARKVKCDFGYPSCSRCAKGPWPVPCVYETPDWEKTQQPVGESVVASTATKAGQPSSETLEAVPLQSTTSDIQNLRMDRTDAAATLNVGTNGTGLTSPSAHTKDATLTCYTRSQPQSHQLPGTRHDKEGNEQNEMFEARFEGLSTLRERAISFDPGVIRSIHQAKDKHRKILASECAEIPSNDASLKTLLPPKPIVERLVTSYFLYHGRIYRILHEPSFRQEIGVIWDDTKEPPAHVCVQLLLVLAIAWVAHASELLCSSPPVLSISDAMKWIKCCDDWGAQYEPKKPCTITFQIDCLLLIAKEVNWTERNQAWVATGHIVKRAMAAGYHREAPPQRGQDSVYLSEIKRRLWTTIVEMDLRASFDRGMQPTIQGDSYDCETPQNIDDRAFEESATVLPEPQPIEVATDSCLQAVLSRSLQLRLRVCALINAPRVNITLEVLTQLDDGLTQLIAEVPTWKDPVDGIEKPELKLGRLHILSVLRRTQMSLHGACVLAKMQEPAFAQSWYTRFEAAAILLYEQSRILDTMGEVGWIELAESTLQAIMTVCHHLYIEHDDAPRSLAGHGGPFSSSMLLSRIIPSAAESIMNLVSKMIGHFEKKALVTTKGTREYALIGMTGVIVKTRLWPQFAAELEDDYARRFKNCTDCVLASLKADKPDRATESPAIPASEGKLVNGTVNPAPEVLSTHLDSMSSGAVAVALTATGFENIELSSDWLDFFEEEDEAMDLKAKGNELFKAGDYVGAEDYYTQANRSLCRLKLQYFVGAEDDARKTLSLLAPKNYTQRIKSQYVLAQALIGQNRASEALEVAMPAYHQAVELNNSNSEPLSRVILEAKKGVWQVKETARLREEDETLRNIEIILETETAKQLAELQASYDAGECGRIGFLEDQDALRKELQEKEGILRRVFADAKGGNMRERVVPDYLIDQITFEIMHDPVITKSGHSFERAVITRHLHKHPHDPITRERMTVDDLRPNYALKTACQEFLDKNGWAVDW